MNWHIYALLGTLTMGFMYYGFQNKYDIAEENPVYILFFCLICMFAWPLVWLLLLIFAYDIAVDEYRAYKTNGCDEHGDL